MNYRHAFHAGNVADVHKHLVLVGILDYLLQKPKPLLYLDTHAGRGLYDLYGEEAARGQEWQQGIGQLMTHSLTAPLTTRYLEVIRAMQPDPNQLRVYPGSPLLANHLLRDSDRRVFIERHAEECVALRKALRQLHAPQLTIDDSDGYHALKQFLPPKEKRGLVLIDPPYEDPTEFRTVADALIQAATRWPTGVFALWYPLKSGGLVKAFYAALKQSGLKKLLLTELWIRPLDTPTGLNGSGMVILNPPWQLDEQLRTACGELLPLLSARASGHVSDHVNGQGGYRVEWLAPE